MNRFRFWMLTAGGLGHAPIASGTFGSLPPVILAFLLVQLGQPPWIVNLCMALLIVAFSIACLRFGSLAEARYGKKDPGQVVADEVAGQAVALLFLPWNYDGTGSALVHNALLAIGAFLAFRFFDILKPPPARSLERLGGGAGILVDDLITGAMALVVVQFVAWMVA